LAATSCWFIYQTQPSQLITHIHGTVMVGSDK